jgi:hypothetical protein
MSVLLVLLVLCKNGGYGKGTGMTSESFFQYHFLLSLFLCETFISNDWLSWHLFGVCVSARVLLSAQHVWLLDDFDVFYSGD